MVKKKSLPFVCYGSNRRIKKHVVRKQLWLWALFFLGITICGCEGHIQTKLDNSIGLSTYENLGLIEQKPIGVGLVIDEKLKSASINVRYETINFTMAVGEALTTRLMYALVLQFQRVQLLKQPVLPKDGSLDLLMVVRLKDIDATVKFTPKWQTVATHSSGWIEVEAVLKDRNYEIVWVGTSRAEAQESQESIMVAQGQQAGAAVNRAIEVTVAKLVHQLAISGSLREFISKAKSDRKTK